MEIAYSIKAVLIDINPRYIVAEANYGVDFCFGFDGCYSYQSFCAFGSYFVLNGFDLEYANHMN